jgi:lysophospholipase L1-like esterase
MLLTRSFTVLLWCALLLPLCAADAPPAFALRSNDVVAFIGGSDVAAGQFSGHLETLLAVKFPGTRFRNFGWEGDTVFAQPRDVGFPPLTNHLKRAGVTVLFLEFGRAEALSAMKTVPEFLGAYEKLLNQFSQDSSRIVLVTPPPFEDAGDPLPDLSKRNKELAGCANAVRTLGQRRGLPVVDLFSEFGGAAPVSPRLTDNGFQFTPRGHALLAAGFARRLGFGELAAAPGTINEQGQWSNLQFEKLRQLVVEKNKLWFNYWRPQNWAFLGGDRTTQPSSRDHRDLKVRWFPAEMEKYVPLIRAKEEEMEQVAAQLRGGR